MRVHVEMRAVGRQPRVQPAGDARPEVAVYGVPDETWGEHVKASVVLMPGSRLTAEALRQYCRAHMPTFRAPKEIEIVPELPKGATGKVLTAVLRARSVQAS